MVLRHSCWAAIVSIATFPMGCADNESKNTRSKVVSLGSANSEGETKINKAEPKIEPSGTGSLRLLLPPLTGDPAYLISILEVAVQSESNTDKTYSVSKHYIASEPISINAIDPGEYTVSVRALSGSKVMQKGQAPVAIVAGKVSSVTVNLTVIQLPSEPQSMNCEKTPDGGIENQVQFKDVTARYGECQSETQTRSCSKGVLSPWSGTFKQATCIASPLLSGFKAYDYLSDGKARVLVSSPADFTSYGSFKIVRQAGNNLPGENCDLPTDQLRYQNTRFLGISFIDDVIPGADYTYRICIFKKSTGSILGTMTAYFRAAPLGTRVSIGNANENYNTDAQISGPYLLWQSSSSYLSACDTRIIKGQPSSCDPSLDNRIDAAIVGSSQGHIDGSRIVFRQGGTAINFCDMAQNGNAGGCRWTDSKIQISRPGTDNERPWISGNNVLWHQITTGNGRRIMICNLNLPSTTNGSCEIPIAVVENTNRLFSVSTIGEDWFVVSAGPQGDHIGPRYCNLRTSNCANEQNYVSVSAGSIYGYNAIVFGANIAWQEPQADVGPYGRSIFRCDLNKNGTPGGCLPSDTKTRVLMLIESNTGEMRASGNRYLVWNQYRPEDFISSIYRFCDTALPESTPLSCYSASEKGAVGGISDGLVLNAPAVSETYFFYRTDSSRSVVVLQRR